MQNIINKIVLIACTANLLAGCQSINKNVSKISQNLLSINSPERVLKKKEKERIQSLPISNPLRQDDLNKYWKRIVDDTDSKLVSENRIRIRADGAIYSSKYIAEDRLLIRAAGETINSGKDGFSIAYISYYHPGPKISSLFIPEINFNDARWIGNYEELSATRNEQNMFSRRDQIQRKAVEGVIIMMDESEYIGRDRFSASEIFYNLIEERK